MNRAPNITKQHWLRLSAALTLLYLFTACNALKYVPEDEKLYTGAEIEMDLSGAKKGKAELSSAIQSAVYPEPNSKFLGMRIGLWAHYKTQGDTAGFIARFINKRFGEEPVYLSDVNTSETRNIFENRAISQGFFYPEIKAEIRENEKTGSAYYQIKVGSAYQLKTYSYERDSLYIDHLIGGSLNETELRTNSVFSVEGFKKKEAALINF
ncbi:MAG: hypothetical protein U5L96_20265 [Owenweeksia sp.]|nr:hypothetical protein [Owenweeksia sp.]